MSETSYCRTCGSIIYYVNINEKPVYTQVNGSLKLNPQQTIRRLPLYTCYHNYSASNINPERSTSLMKN